MRFAEVFLRLGSALVAWMMMYAYFLWLAAVYVVACGADGDEMHRLLLGLAPFVWLLRTKYIASALRFKRKRSSAINLHRHKDIKGPLRFKADTQEPSGRRYHII